MVLENFIVDAPIVWDRVGKKIFENPHVKQGRKMRVQINNAGMVEDLSGYTLALGWKHTVSGVDGLDVFEDSSEANVGIFEMAYTENLMTNLGNLKASLVLTSVEDMVVAESNDFYVKVDDSPFGADAEQGVGSYTRLAQILLNEESRIAAEVARVSAEETRVADFNALVDGEIIAQNVASKLQAKEAEYLPRLVANEQQLADIELVNKANQFRLNNVLRGKCIGHRGCGYAPENTMAAFEIAKKMGFKAVETDVLVTSDGVLVIHHDTTVDRMTNGTGTVSAMTLAQIKALNIDTGTNVTAFPTQKIPTFEELLAWLKANDMGLVLELKPIFNAQNTLNIYNLLKKYNMLDKTILTSFHLSALEAMRAVDPIIPLGYARNGDVLQADIDALKASLGSYCGLSPYRSSTTQNGIDLAHANDMFVIVWDVNTVKYAQTAIKTQSADYITTDTISEAVYYGTI